MKNSETDRELFDSIKSTLDNYEEHYILGAWEGFVRKRKKRRKIIFWWLGAGVAACFIIGWFGINILFPDSVNPSGYDKQIRNTSDLPIPVKGDSLQKNLEKREDNLGGKEIKTIKTRNNTLVSNGLAVTQPKNRNHEESLDTSKKYNSQLNYRSESDTETRFRNPVSATISAQPVSDTLKEGKSTSESSVTYKSYSQNNSRDSSGYKPEYKITDPKTAMADEIPTANPKRKIRFGVNFSPGVNSTSTSSAFNYSGGINADIALFSEFRLSTGLQVEHQSVVNNNPGYYPGSPEGQTKADLIDLDLPLNITWKFLIRKSTCYYISGGISSMVYLSEKYTNTSYTRKMVAVVEVSGDMENIVFQVENIKATEMETETPFNTFDFAGRVNILFGLEQHLSSKLFLHIEPYLKIPVSGLATQNMRYTTSGITCKISF